MSTHPNAMLQAVLTCDDLTRATVRRLYEAAKARGFNVDLEDDEPDIGIPNGETTRRGDGGENPRFDDYHVTVMEGDYNESWQIAAKTGQIVLHDFLTYGYGESMAWDKVVAQKDRLTAFLDAVKDALHFTYEIRVAANYW